MSRKQFKLFQQYRGPLTPEQAADGSNAARRNARRLLEDAKLLFKARSFPSAASMAILAAEEYGKLPILDDLASASKSEQIKERWGAYRSHTKKNLRLILPDLVDQGPTSVEKLLSFAHPDSPHPGLFEQLKQLGFYTDCVDDGRWIEPTAAISEELAERLITAASRILAADKEVLTEDIALRVDFRRRLQEATERAEAEGRELSKKEAVEFFLDYLRKAREQGISTLSDKAAKELFFGQVDLRDVGTEE